MPTYSDYLRKLTSDPSDRRAIEKLESLGVETLTTVEAVSALTDARETLRGLGELEAAERLLNLQIRSAVETAEALSGDKNEKRALEAWRMVLRLDRNNERAQTSVRKLLTDGGHFSGLIEFLKEAEAQKAREDVGGRIAVLVEIAAIYRTHLRLDAMVIQTCKAILELDPDHAYALAQLADRYRALSRWNDLYGVLMQQAQNRTLPDEQRSALWAEAATLATDRLSNPARAIEPLKELLALVPGDAARRNTLREIYEKRRQWKELCELIEDSARAAEPEAQTEILLEAARLATQRLSDPDTASRIWQHVLDHVKANPNPEVEREALTQLARLYERDKKYEPLYDVYVRQVELEKDSGRAVEVLEKLGVVCLERIGNKELALDVYQDILSRVPNHPKALRIVRDVFTEQQDDVALEQLYAERGQWEELVELLFSWSENASDRGRRLHLLRRSAEIAGTRLNNVERVARAYERILAVEPTDVAAARALLSIYEQGKKWPRLQAMQELVLTDPNLSDKERADLLRQMAHLQGSVLKNYARQAEHLQKLLDMEPEDRVAMAALEQAALQRADWRALQDVYRRMAKIMPPGPERLELLQKTAALEEERLKDGAAAIATYQEIIRLDPNHSRAPQALARLLQNQGDWDALASTLEKQLERAEGKDRVQLYVALGELYENKLNAPERALEYYKGAFKAGSSKAICTALERFMADRFPLPMRVDVARLLLSEYKDQADNTKIARVLQVLRLEATGHSAAELDRRLLQLLANRVDGKRTAFDHGLSALSLDPFHGPTRERMMSLARELKAEAELAATLGRAWQDRRPSDPAELKRFGVELAQLCQKLGDSSAAECIWHDLLRADPRFARARTAIDSLLDSSGRYEELYAFWSDLLPHETEPNARLALLARLASLAETRLGRNEDAMRWYREMAAAGHKDATRALERLLLQVGRFTELADVLAEEQNKMVGAPAMELLFRRARLCKERLEQPEVAVELCARILEQDSCHGGARDLLEEQVPKSDRAMSVLEEIYEREASWAELARLLGHRIEAPEPGEVRYHVRLAELLERRLGDEPAAFARWSDVLARDPQHELALKAVLRLGKSLGKSPEVAEFYKSAAAVPELDSIRHKQLLAELARLYQQELGDRERAVSVYENLLNQYGDDPGVAHAAAVALCQLYADLGRWQALVDCLHRRAEWTDSSHERIELFSLCARLYEDRLEAPEQAIGDWQRVLELDPTYLEALSALERLYDQAGQGAKLRAILEKRLPLLRSADERKAYRVRMAELAQAQGVPASELVELWQAVLSEHPREENALVALTTIYRDVSDAEALVAILDQRRALPGNRPEEICQLLCESADVLRVKLERHAEALEHYITVLRSDPDNAGAIAGIKQLVDVPALFEDASEVLINIYQRHDEFEPLARLLQRKAEQADGILKRAALLRRAAELWEARVGDSHKSMAAYTACIETGAESPDVAEAMDQLVRVAIESKRRKELIPLFRKVIPQLSQPELLRKAQFVVADTARALGDNQVAESYYENVLEMSPADDRALTSLEEMYRARRDAPALYALLERRARLADTEGTRGLFLGKMAHLSTQALNNPDQAITLWNDCLALDPDHGEAQAALEEIYETRADWPALIALLEQRIERTERNEAIVNMRVRLGGIYSEKLKNIGAAIEQYAEVLNVDPIQPDAVRCLLEWLADPDHRVEAARALAAAYAITQSWSGLVRVNRILLSDKTLTREERLRLVQRIAELHEDQLDDLEGAFQWYQKVFEEDPDDRPVRTKLERLANVLGSWEALAHTYTKACADAPAERRQELSRALVEIWDRLNQVEPARDAYLNLLEQDPTDTEALDRLVHLLTRSGRREDLAAAYHTVAKASVDPTRRLELFLWAGRIRKPLAGQAAGAIDSFKQALTVDRTSLLAWESLEEIYQRDGMWKELAELLSERIADADDVFFRRPFRMRLADVYENRLQDLPSALDQYEALLHEEDNDPGAVAQLERLVVDESVRERIISLLEPVYRAHDQWRKLVVILDARLQYIEDTSTRVSTLIEIARLHETRGGDPFLAFNAWAKAWQSEPGDTETYQALVALGIRLEHWEPLVDALEAGLAVQPDNSLARDVLARIADLQETRLSNLRAAIDAWNRLLKQAPDDEAALESLDRLLEETGDELALADVLEKRATLTNDVEGGRSLWKRLGYLSVALERPDAAIRAFNEANNLFSGDAEVLSELHLLYDRLEKFRDLATVLLAQIEVEVDPHAASEFRRKLAMVYRRHLDEPLEAISQLRALLEDAPDDRAALEEISEIYAQVKMWSEHCEALDRRSELETDPGRAADLSLESARVTFRELGDSSSALERLARIIDAKPDHAEARAFVRQFLDNEDTLESAARILERVYRNERKFDEVAALYERRLAVASIDSEARLADLSALAEVHERGRGDIRAAFEVWVRALAESSDGEEARGQLERLATEASLWKELAEVYRARLGGGLESEVRARYLVRLAEILDRALEDPTAARDAYAEAVDVVTDPRPVLAQLVNLSERLNQWKEAVDYLERHSRIENEPSERVRLLYRASEIYEHRLDKPAEALALYREIVELEPAHLSTRAALSRLLAAPGLSLAVIEVLEPLCETENNADGLVLIQERKLELEKHPDERARLYRRLIDLREKDPEQALLAAGRWFREKPDSEEARSIMFSLCERTGRWPQIATLLGEVLAETTDARVRHRLLLDLGDVRVLHLNDLDGAQALFEEAFKLQPDDMLPLASLEDIERRRGSYDGLLAILLRRAEVEHDSEVRRACHAERARMQRDAGDIRGAEKSWKAVLEVHSDDREAAEELSTVYRRLEAWPALVDILGTRAAFSKDVQEERQLRTEMARIYSGLLRDEAAAIDVWRSILELDPGAEDALTSLEEAYVAGGAWADARDILKQRLAKAMPEARVDILIRLAWVLEEKLEDAEEAIEVLEKALEIDPLHAAAVAAYDRLLARAERFAELAQFLEKHADRVLRDDVRLAHRFWVRAAEIKADQLGDAAGADALLSRVLEQSPNDVYALLRQAQLLEKEGEWDRAARALERALQSQPTGADGANLYIRLAVVARHRGDDDAAVRAWFAKALELDPGHVEAIAELEAYARQAKDWSTVADMVARRAAALGASPERIPLARELAEICVERFQQPAWAVTYLEDALAHHPQEDTLLIPLCEALEKSGDKARAVELLTKLAETAHAKRQFRQCAGYRRRLGVLAVDMGDDDQARQHLEAAFRLDPTDVGVMIALGSLLMRKEDWEQARKVYRSLVLQEIGANAGMTKADVYLALGRTHAALGENDKAGAMYRRGLDADKNHIGLKQALEALK